MGLLAHTDLRQCPSEHESMPLLQSLVDCAAPVAINMALLTELFASPHHPSAVWKMRVRSSSLLAIFRPTTNSARHF